MTVQKEDSDKMLSISDSYIYAKVGNLYIAYRPRALISNTVVLSQLIIFINTTHISIVLRYKPWTLNELSLAIFCFFTATISFVWEFVEIAIKIFVSCHSAITKFPLCCRCTLLFLNDLNCSRKKNSCQSI